MELAITFLNRYNNFIQSGEISGEGMIGYYEPLTDRELDILELKIKRESNQSIASTLHLSLNTVKWYVSQIYNKLDVKNRRELEKRVHELGTLQSRAVQSEDVPTDFPHVDVDALTTREMQVLQLLAQGYSNEQIASELVIAAGTVKAHVHNISQKLDTKNRTQTVLVAKQLGLLQSGQPAPSKLSPHKLPQHFTSFVGRMDEVQQIIALLQDNHLLTLTGTGGTGKTRISLAVAEHIKHQFSDGIIFVDLSIIQDATQVVNAVASALGLVETTVEPLADTICRGLSNRNTLLILDNFEHVLDSIWLVKDILQKTTNIKIMVTSREPLRLYGEYEYHVPTLSLPQQIQSKTFDNLMQNDAIQLFCQRTRAVNRHFEATPENIDTIANICVKLDGLPLAIELAAARAKILNPQTLLSRLENPLDILTTGAHDLPSRQRTVRDTIAWSYNLLDDTEKQLFMRLAIFRGGRSIEAVEAICMDGLEISVLDGLASLVDKSLLIQHEDILGEPRFWMLETIQEYAHERLTESNTLHHTLDQHAIFFMHLAETAEPELRRHNQQYWYQRLDIELPNMRVALGHTLNNGTGNVEIGVRLLAALSDVWWYGIHHAEADYWVQKALAYTDDIEPLYHGRILFIAGYCHWRLRHKYQITFDYSKMAYEIGLEINDKRLMAMALRYMGGSNLARPKEQLTADVIKNARQYVKQSVELFRQIGDPGQLAHSLNALAELYVITDEFEEAISYYKECINVAYDAGDMHRVVMNKANVARALTHLGDDKQATEVAQESLSIARDMNYTYHIQHLLQLVTPMENPYKATRLLCVSDRMMQRFATVRQPTSQTWYEKSVALMREKLGDNNFEITWQEGKTLSFDDAVAYALDEINPFVTQS